MVLLSCALATAVFVSPSFAGMNEVKECAENLPEAAQKILSAIIPKLKPGADVPKVMKSTVISMVGNGEIDRSKARSNAQAAGRCLKKLQE